MSLSPSLSVSVLSPSVLSSSLRTRGRTHARDLPVVRLSLRGIPASSSSGPVAPPAHGPPPFSSAPSFCEGGRNAPSSASRPARPVHPPRFLQARTGVASLSVPSVQDSRPLTLTPRTVTNPDSWTPRRSTGVSPSLQSPEVRRRPDRCPAERTRDGTGDPVTPSTPNLNWDS